MHQPAWRRSLPEAEFEWLALVLDLRNAAELVAEPSWLDAASAAGQLARAYNNDHATIPVAGLTTMIRPIIDNAINEQAVIREQLLRVVEIDRQRETPILPPSAATLAEIITSHRTGQRSREPSGDNSEGDSSALNRVDQTAPRLRLLGDEAAQLLAQRFSDDELRNLGAVVAASTAAGVLDHPVLKLIRKRIMNELADTAGLDGAALASIFRALFPWP